MTIIRMGIRAWLLTLALASCLPILAFAVWEVWQTGTMRQQTELAAVTTHAETAAAAVGQRIERVVATLAVLAQSDAALSGDLAALHAHARRMLPANPDAIAIALIGPEGQQVFNTLQPYGKQLPPSGDIATARQVFDTGRPAVSGPFKGTVSNKWVASVGVPLVRDGKVVYCLRMLFAVDSLAHLLAGRQTSPDWLVSLFNADAVIVARTLSPETTVGTPASATIADKLRSGRYGVARGVTKEGVVVVTALVQVPGWPWTVASSVPSDVLDAPLRRWMRMVIPGALFLIALAAASAWWLSAHLVRQVRAAARATRALDEGADPLHHGGSIEEFIQMGKALASVKQRAVRTNLALADALVENQQVKADLASARQDPLTGIPARSLFLELAEAAGNRATRTPGEALALMFVDLDGFKQVNDRLGHQRGDEVLGATAQVLRHCVRDSDTLGRMGGDEFAICVTAAAATIEQVAANVASRIVDGVAGIGDGIGCSIGIFVCPPGQADIAVAIKGADEAMYQAKRAGKNRFSMVSRLNA
ncbi:MAG TPA: diguanylate cyclase [Magnetospirillum sp.]|nr:diguanylate cyclase [Magnetospirillum sp.]